MPGPLHFSPLGSEDAPLIGALQRRLFAPELTETDAFIAGILRNTEQHLVCNLSFGLFEGDAMVGYVFAYVESRSLFHDRDEEVVYLKEVALLPGHEPQLRAMFGHLFLQWQAFTPGLPIEAHAVAESMQNWRRLERVFRLYGLTLATREDAARAGGARYWLMRFDVAADTRSLLERPAPPPVATIKAQGLDCCVVTSVQQWLGLRPDWERLRQPAGLAGGAPPFDYLWEWWRHLGLWDLLQVVVMRHQGAVVGIAPLRVEFVRRGAQVLRRLRPIGAGAGGWQPAALLAEDPPRAAAALVATLAAGAPGWDLLDLPGQRAASAQHAAAFRRAFADACAAQDWQTRIHGRPAPWVDLRVAALRAPPSQVAGGNAGSPAAATAAPDAPRIRLVPQPELARGIDAHCAVEEAGGHAGTDVILDADRGLLHFVLRLAAGRPDAGWALLQHVAEVDGRPIASRFGLRDGAQFLVLRAAHVGTAQSLRAARSLEAAERDTLRALGVQRVEFSGTAPLLPADRQSALHLQAFMPAHATQALRQLRRERLADVLDAIAVGGAGRGLARRLRQG